LDGVDNGELHFAVTKSFTILEEGLQEDFFDPVTKVEPGPIGLKEPSKWRKSKAKKILHDALMERDYSFERHDDTSL
jgi:hypothetical protein